MGRDADWLLDKCGDQMTDEEKEIVQGIED